MTEYLSLDDLLQLALDLTVGPVRDVGLLASAAHRPTTSMFGADAYPDLDLKAASLLHSVVGNRALVDGNKRLGWLSVFVFYRLNDVTLEAPDDEAYELVLAVAAGQADMGVIAAHLRRWRTTG